MAISLSNLNHNIGMTEYILSQQTVPRGVRLLFIFFIQNPWDSISIFNVPDFINHKFRKLLKQHGLPHIRFHELRHSGASLLIIQGFTLKDAQEWMGHADIQMTANIYAHLDVARKVSMADTLAGNLVEKC